MTKTELSFYCERLTAEIKHLQALHNLLMVAAQDDNLEEPYISSTSKNIISDVKEVGFKIWTEKISNEELQQPAEYPEKAPF